MKNENKKLEELVDKYGLDKGNPEAEKIMDAKISRVNNPAFVQTLYNTNIEDRALQATNGHEPAFTKNDIMRTAETLDNYSNISNAVKKLIAELGLKSKK